MKFKKKVKNNLKKEFGSKPVYNENYLKAKVKSYNEKIKTNFHDNKIPKEGSQFICLCLFARDFDWSCFWTGKNYYPQVLLEECKYVAREKKIPKYIIDDIEISSDFDEDNSDEENTDEEILKKNQIQKNSDEKDSS